jgi:dihydroneopterin aldolase
MAIIELENMEFYSYHGHFREEQVVGNHFLIDLRFETDTSRAQHSDQLTDTVNYQVVYTLVKNEMAKKSKLLEHVAQRILNAIFNEFEGISEASVKVSKLNPPMGGKIQKVSVTLSRKRDAIK